MEAKMKRIKATKEYWHDTIYTRVYQGTDRNEFATGTLEEFLEDIDLEFIEGGKIIVTDPADVAKWWNEIVNEAKADTKRAKNKIREVAIVLIGSTYWVKYVSRRKFTRHSAAQFYAPDNSLHDVQDYVRNHPYLTLVDAPEGDGK